MRENCISQASEREVSQDSSALTVITNSDLIRRLAEALRWAADQLPDDPCPDYQAAQNAIAALLTEAETTK